MEKSFSFWMNCLKRRRSLFSQINVAVIPVLCGVMLFVTGVAVLYGHFRVKSVASNGEFTNIFWENVMFTGCAEFIGLLIGILTTCFLTRRLLIPVETLANEARELAGNRSDRRLDESVSVEEFSLLANAFNRLLEEKQRRVVEISSLGENLLHDIRTPLATLRNEAELALRHEKDAEEALAQIYESSDYLLGAAAADAEIASFASGAIKHEREWVNLSDVVSSTAQIFTPVGDERNLTIDTIVPAVPVMLRGQKRQFQKIVSNLLDNAVKFTNGGGRIAVGLQMSGSAISLVVEDSGIGISEEDRHHVFDRHFRADASRHCPGFGLGLSLVKAIVESYGGTVDCASELGRGSVFRVVLPVTEPGDIP